MMQPTVSTDTTALTSIRDSAGLVTSKLERWMELVIAKLPNFVVALLVVGIAWVIARVVRDTLRNGLHRTRLTAPVVSLITTMIGVMVISTGFVVSLGVLGLDKAVTSLLTGVGILGLALGFAFQEIGANFMAGVILSVKQSFAIGHVIRSNDHTGTVREITLQSTSIQQFSGEMVWLPNRHVIGNPLVNFSTAGERRVDLDVGVSYGDDLEKARRVATAAVEALPDRRDDRPVTLFFTGFGDSSINFTIRFWVDFTRQPDYLGACSEAIIAIKKAFDQEGISIPFPIRTLDFSPVGGVTLGEVRPRGEAA